MPPITYLILRSAGTARLEGREIVMQATFETDSNRPRSAARRLPRRRTPRPRRAATA
jgi:hypothetical protein